MKTETKLPKLISKRNCFGRYAKITKEQLKATIFLYYYPIYRSDFVFNSPLWKQMFDERRFIETRIKDNYGGVSTIIFSINGSPPKGRAIFFLDNANRGDLVMFSDTKVSKRYPIEIVDLNGDDENEN